MPSDSLYDEIPYPSDPLPQTHPDRLATLAYLFGMQPAPPERCRVLELGCGNGANLIPMAAMLRSSQFVGVDLARVPIEAANAAVKELALANCAFHAADLTALTPEFGRFDYIIAHGVYSWTPAPVRDALLRVCHDNLAPQGVAYVSYNTLPGCHQRSITRDMMLYHTQGAEGPEARLESAMSLIRFLAEAGPKSGALRDELNAVQSRDPFALFHDDLADVNQPEYFHDFVRHARSHGLEFLAEAQFSAMQDGAYPPAVVERLREFSRGDRILKQQYLDFLKCRRFRQTLLCRAETPIADPPDPRRVERLLASSAAAPVSETPDIEGTAEEEFRAPGGASIRTNLPFVKAVMTHLQRSWPRPARFEELLDRSKAERATLADLLLRTYASGLIELHSVAPTFCLEVRERPRAFAPARRQASRSNRVVTMRHSVVDIKDELARRLICLLDGARDRTALLHDLQPAAGNVTLRLEDLDNGLAALARMALLEG